MIHVHSITSRITGLMFLSILFTVAILVYLANHQMSLHFGEYLAAQHAGHEYRTRTLLENIPQRRRRNHRPGRIVGVA